MRHQAIISAKKQHRVANTGAIRQGQAPPGALDADWRGRLLAQCGLFQTRLTAGLSDPAVYSLPSAIRAGESNSGFTPSAT
jgi:hypothetical protein